LEQWVDLLRTENCRFVALQHGEHKRELTQVCGIGRCDVLDLGDSCTDIDDLASVVCALDLVVTVDNTLAHLSGALGVPTWVLLSVSPEWRYPRSGTVMPWYPSMRLFRQRAAPDWSSVFDQLKSELADAGKAS
jgi:ADP-heptose:LPS heptosyltransferase